MEELKVTEEPENQILWIETNKRKSKLKVFVHPADGFGFWRVAYEDGRKINDLAGKFLSKSEALKAVREWIAKTKKSETAKQYELFGDKEPPVLKRKKVRGRTSSTDDS